MSPSAGFFLFALLPLVPSASAQVRAAQPPPLSATGTPVSGKSALLVTLKGSSDGSTRGGAAAGHDRLFVGARLAPSGEPGHLRRRMADRDRRDRRGVHDQPTVRAGQREAPELDLPESRLAKVHYNWMYGVGYQQVYAKNTAGNQWVLPLVDVSPGAVYFNWQFQLSSTSLAEVFQALPSSCQQRSERATSRRLCTRYFSMSGA